MRIISALVLPAALGIYLSLALAGIHYGLPHKNHLLSYAADETTWLEALSRLHPRQLQFNPHPGLAHPTFYLEAYGAALGVLTKTGWIAGSQNKDWYRDHPEQFARIYLAGRYLQVLFGLLLLLAVWAVAYAYLNPAAAAFSALLLSITPSFIGASHFSQANIPVACLAFLSLGAMLLHEQAGERQPGWLRAAAFLCGLAISTKYSALPLGIPLTYWALQKSNQRWREISLLGGLLLFGFFLGSPFAFLSPQTFWPAFHRFMKFGSEPVGGGLFGKFLFPWKYPLRHALGLPLELFSIVALIWHFGKGRRSITLALWIPAFLLGTITAGYVASSARVLVVVPTLLLMVGEMLSAALRWNVVLGLGGTASLMAATILPTLAIVSLHRRPPAQMIASQWIEEHIPAGTSIGIPREVFWWTPPIIYTSAEHPERLEKPYPIRVLHFSVEEARREQPDYILLSGAERTNDAPRYPGGRELVAWLDAGTAYQKFKVFPRDIRWRSWTWNRPELLLYTDDDLWSPSQEIFKRLPPPQ